MSTTTYSLKHRSHHELTFYENGLDNRELRTFQLNTDITGGHINKS